MSFMAGGRGGSHVLPSWSTPLFFLLLIGCPSLMAFPDDESQGESFVTGGGIFLVLMFNAVVMVIVMIMYYWLVASEKVFFRGNDEIEASGLLLPKEKGSWVGESAHNSISDQDPDSSTLSFPPQWKRKSNPLSRFFYFWASWYDGVIAIPERMVIENAGLLRII